VMENIVSNAERRALAAREPIGVPRVLDIYSALPSITGKIELEYEGELKGGDAVARDLIRMAVGKIYNKYYEGVNVSPIVQWFDLGGALKLDETENSASMLGQLGSIQGLLEKVRALGLGSNEPDALRVSAAEFILEGLYAHRRISRSEERGFAAEEKKRDGIGKDDEGNIYDYGATAMDAVWDEIEEAGVPIGHHIGETPPKTPCENNSVVVGMMVNVDSFREQFAKYVFSGILDRHPRLKIGWFEGGIAWVPTALQDAEHMLASYRHMFNHQLEHDVRHYWDNHMSASFMVDPLGLRLIDQIGVDNVMWSSDYPHNESTFGYSEKSLAAVVEAVGPENAVKIVSGNIKKFLSV